MKKIIVFSLILFSLTTIYPQKIITTPLIQAFNKGAISNYGTSTLVNKVENIAYLNPSALNHFKNLSVGFSYQFESTIDDAYFADIGYSRISEGTPESFGVVYFYENFRIGFGFGQAYNGKLDIGRVSVTTPQNPDGIGETYEPVFETTSQSFVLATSYSVENIFESNDEISIGFRLNRNILHYTSKLDQISIEEKIYSYSFAVGTNYYIDLLNSSKLGVGLFYESEMEFSKYSAYKDLAINRPDTTLGEPYGINSMPVYLTGRMPPKLIFDVDFDVNEEIKILGTISTVFWNDLDNGYSNQINFSSSAVYSLFENIDLSAGFFSLSRKYESDELDHYIDVEEGENAVYLTAGVNVKYSGFDLDLSLADSHMFSGDWRKQTIVKVGLGYSL